MFVKRLYGLMAALALLALVAGACGAQPTGAPTEAPATQAPEATPTEAPTEAPTEPPAASAAGQIVIWTDEGRFETIRALADDFEAKYGVPVVVEQLGFGDIRDQFKVAGPAGEGPDIITGAHDWLGELAENGLLAEIDLGEKEEQFLEAARKAFTYDGVLYGMPYLTENIALFYNTELVSEPPATWEEVTALAEVLESAGDVTQGYVLHVPDPYHFFPIMTAHGGYVFGQNPDGTYNAEDVGIDSEGSLAATRWLDMMVKEGHLQAGVDFEIAHTMFQTGEAAMMLTGPWALTRIRESGVPYAIADIPDATQEAQPFLGVHGFMVSAFSQDPLLAQTFLTEFVATEETMTSFYEKIPHSSAFIPVREKIEDQDLAAFAAAGTNGLPMPAIPEMSAVWSAWGDALTLIFNQQEDAETAFKNAAEQIRTAIGQ